MPVFDVSQNWVILSPPGAHAAAKASEDLARCIGLLRGQGSAAAEILDSSGAAPAETVPVIVLNSGDSSGSEGGVGLAVGRNGFSWRAASARVEIYGESAKGLCNGIYDFLCALGISWPAPDFAARRARCQAPFSLPPARGDGLYPLKKTGAYEPSGSGGAGPGGKAAQRRFVLPEKCFLRTPEKREALLAWAARNKYDALVFSFSFWASAKKTKIMQTLLKEAEAFAVGIEAGGPELSALLPRRLFFFHRELFRMEGGKRRKEIHFCPTNPETIETIKTEAKKLFRSARGVKVFHLWPEKGEERTWCACPSCRAFSHKEQYLIAANAAAGAFASSDALAADAALSIIEIQSEGSCSIPLPPNVFIVESQRTAAFSGSRSFITPPK